jgi:hypothetical protein
MQQSMGINIQRLVSMIMKMHSMGIEIMPMLGTLDPRMVDPSGPKFRIVCKWPQLIAPQEALIPVYITRDNPGNMDDIITNTFNVYIN